MRYGWRWMLAPLWAACLAGAVLIVCFSAGWYTWQAFALAGGIGLAAGIPLGIWTARKLRRQDPGWPTPDGAHR